METATLAGGCFWCTEAIFKRLKGVESTVPGYTGGTLKNPTYDQVSLGKSSHAEDYHKNYYERNTDQPYCQIVIDPKIQKLYQEFKEEVKK